MNKTMKNLSALRPQITLDDVWTREEQALARERILTDREAAPRRRQSRRVKAAIAGVTAVGLLAVPGVAGAVNSNGLRPMAFVDAYFDWTDFNPNGPVDASTAMRVGSVPGPDGTVFSVLRAENSEGQTCLAPLFETPGSAADPQPTNFRDGGAVCDFGLNEPLGTSAQLWPLEAGTVWYANAGEATDAEIRLQDGKTLPVIVSDGWLFGWTPAGTEVDQPPTVVGRDSDGTVIDTFPLTLRNEGKPV